MLMPGTARIYMAGPLGFSEAGRHFHASVLVPYVRALGYEVVDPWALIEPSVIDAARAMPPGPARQSAWERLNREMGARNCDRRRGRRRRCPRRPDVDSGTAAEIGYAFARGKLIVGYRGDYRSGRSSTRPRRSARLRWPGFVSSKRSPTRTGPRLQGSRPAPTRRFHRPCFWTSTSPSSTTPATRRG